MPDLGLSVLLKGKNMVRLLGGLWVALKDQLDLRGHQPSAGYPAGHPHDMEESGDKSSATGVSGDCPHHAADGTAVSRVFRHDADAFGWNLSAELHR